MKRSRLRRKSKTPRPWIDEEARRAYRDAHPRDEIEEHLAGPVWDKVKLNDYRTDLDVHHVLHFNGIRWDIPQNLLMVTRRAHDLIHHQDAIGGQLAAIYAKFHNKRRDRRIAMREILRAKYSRDPITWVELKLDEGVVPWWYEDTALSLLEMF